MIEKVRYTYRLRKELLETIESSAKEKGISINSEINNILVEYYNFKNRNPEANVWSMINSKKKEV